MKHVVFDSYALIALFRGEQGADFVRDMLLKASKNETTIWLSVINMGEIFYMISRKSNTKKAELAVESILQFPITIIDADLNHTLEAATLKARFKLSYADAFAASIAIQKKATLITGDKEFLSLTNEKNFKMHLI